MPHATSLGRMPITMRFATKVPEAGVPAVTGSYSHHSQTWEGQANAAGDSWCQSTTTGWQYINEDPDSDKDD